MPHIEQARHSHVETAEDRRELGAVIALDRVRAQREFAATGRERHATTSSLRAPKPCGHDRHVGPCPACQRAQLARWNSQLVAVGLARAQ
jgi:hypothetical protein